jgi:hypothetical protein
VLGLDPTASGTTTARGSLVVGVPERGGAESAAAGEEELAHVRAEGTTPDEVDALPIEGISVVRYMPAILTRRALLSKLVAADGTSLPQPCSSSSLTARHSSSLTISKLKSSSSSLNSIVALTVFLDNADTMIPRPW